MEEKNITVGTDAESAVRRVLEARYGDKLKQIKFRRSWLTASASQQLWDVKGTLKLKRGLLPTATRNFRYQIDAITGVIIGHEEVTPK